MLTHTLKVSQTVLNFDNLLQELKDLNESDYNHGYSLFWGKETD